MDRHTKIDGCSAYRSNYSHVAIKCGCENMDIPLIKNKKHYKVALVVVECLMENDPVPNSKDGRLLIYLSEEIEKYENEMYPSKK